MRPCSDAVITDTSFAIPLNQAKLWLDLARMRQSAHYQAQCAPAQVRWYQMEAAKSGKPLASLMADFNASRKAQEQHFQVALSALNYSAWQRGFYFRSTVTTR